jgi:ATP-dependent exoDNAse (exonuclease V) beta subunit
VSDLRDLVEQESGTMAAKKTFKDYEPRFLQIDITYLPQMPDEMERRNLFVAMERATCWVYIGIYADQNESSSVDFLAKVTAACPIKISKLLRDNGSQFTDRFTSKSKKKVPSGQHLFDRPLQTVPDSSIASSRHAIRKPMASWGAPMAVSARSSIKPGSAPPPSWNRRSATNARFQHQTPIQALTNWQEKQPNLFVKLVYNQAGLDKWLHQRNRQPDPFQFRSRA